MYRCRPFGLFRLFLALLGLGWLAAPDEPRDEDAMNRWRERRRRFRRQMRSAVRELFDDGGGQA